MLDDYIVEVDDSDRRRVVLVIRALRLIVIGTTLDEAAARAAVALAFRTQNTDLPSTPIASRQSADSYAAPSSGSGARAA